MFSKNLNSLAVIFGVFLLTFSYTIECTDYFTEKPSWMESCKIYAKSGFTACSTRSVQAVMNQVTKGIPEVTAAVGELDPMKLDKLVFKQDNNEVATIRADISELLVRGFSKMVIKESKVSKKDFSWQTKIFMPSLKLDGRYKMDGRILLLPLKGNGKISLELENLDILMWTKTHLYEKGGFTFYNVTNVRVQLNMTGLKANLDNLFNGQSKEIERSTNQFFNDNWRDFFEALRPLVTETVERVLLNLLHNIFNIIPANFFVEDIPTSAQLYGNTNS